MQKKSKLAKLTEDEQRAECSLRRCSIRSKRRGSGLLITVDEVRPMVEEVVLLVSTYQLLVREGHKVALVMAVFHPM